MVRAAVLAAVLSLPCTAGAFTPLRAIRLDHVTYKGPRFDEASTMYQKLMQMPLVRHIPNDTDYLGIGDNNFFGIQIHDVAYIDHFCIGLDTFELNNVLAAMKQFNLTASSQYVNTVKFFDPNGFEIQICTRDYSDNQTWDFEGLPRPKSFSPLQAVTFDHVIIKVADMETTSLMYQKLFGLPLVREIKGEMHYLAVGNNSFLGVQPSGTSKGFIANFGVGLKDFDAAAVEGRVKELGLKLTAPSEPDTVRFADTFGYPMQLCSTDYAYKQMHMHHGSAEPTAVIV